MDYVEPFRAPLVEGVQTTNGDIRRMVGVCDALVRVEELHAFEDLSEYRSALRLFSDISGIAVVPYAMAIGESQPLGEAGFSKYGHNDVFSAVFYVTDEILTEGDGETDDPQNFPPEVMLQLAEGLASYYIHLHETGDPYSYEIRPAQFMYGRTQKDTKPQLYMVDLDYALSANLTPSELVGKLNGLVDYIEDCHQFSLFNECAEHILRYITTGETFSGLTEADSETQLRVLGYNATLWSRLVARLEGYVTTPAVVQ